MPVVVAPIAFVLALTMAAGGPAAPVPALDVAELLRASDLVVGGTASTVRSTGRTTVATASGPVEAQGFVATIQVVDTFLGTPLANEISVPFAVPAGSGYGSVPTSRYRVFFIKRSGNSMAFTSPYYPSILGLQTSGFRNSAPLNRVAERVAAVLESPASSRSDQLDAVYTLSRIQGSTVALESLAATLRANDTEVRLSAAGALLSANQLAALPIAEAALSAPASHSRGSLMGLRIGIARGVSDPAAVGLLAKLMISPDVETRRAAGEALSRSVSSTAREPLSTALNDLDREVRFFAVLGLAKLFQEPDWTPNMEQFFANEAKYLRYWRDRVRDSARVD